MYVSGQNQIFQHAFYPVNLPSSLVPVVPKNWRKKKKHQPSGSKSTINHQPLVLVFCWWIPLFCHRCVPPRSFPGRLFQWLHQLRVPVAPSALSGTAHSGLLYVPVDLSCLCLCLYPYLYLYLYLSVYVHIYIYIYLFMYIYMYSINITWYCY